MNSVIKTQIPNKRQSKLVLSWLILGLSALVASGLFSILLVVSRTPGIQNYIPWIDFFHTALVAHVDLSVLIWFLSFSCVFWSLSSPRVTRTDWLALGLAIIGTLIIAISPFLGEGKPLINNYVPVLQQPLFLIGLLVFSGGCVLRLITRVCINPVSSPASSVFDQSTFYAAIISLLTFAAFIWTFMIVPKELEGTSYYELLFWGPGHILQFSHTVLMLAGWLLLASVGGGSVRVSSQLTAILLLLAALPALYSIVILMKEIGVQRVPFTQLMTYGGLAAIPAGILAIAATPWKINSASKHPGARAALRSSIVLFAIGGIFAFMIDGVNVIIPAHYHGSIVGVTLAFFGITYYLLPLLGHPITLTRLSVVQPYVYATGQLMHITGLAWSGGYGVQRKTAGAAQGLERLPEIAGMALMGTGGLVAIIGGLLFLIVAFHALIKK